MIMAGIIIKFWPLKLPPPILAYIGQHNVLFNDISVTQISYLFICFLLSMFQQFYGDYTRFNLFFTLSLNGRYYNISLAA